LKFSIIIATCDRPERLARALECLRASVEATGGPHAVIVVDNGGRLPCREIVEGFAGISGLELTYLQSSPGNKSRALNTGIAAAQTEWLAFTDDDTIPDRDWLKNAVRFAASCDTRVFGGRIVHGEPEHSLPSWLSSDAPSAVRTHGIFVSYSPLAASGVLDDKMTVPYGANIFVKRDVFAECGNYDEELWDLCGRAALGSEDGEFGFRIRRMGETIGYCHDAVVIHPVHHGRCRFAVQLRLSYGYGWREPLVLLEANSSPLDLHRLRMILWYMVRAMAAGLRGDRVRAADSVFRMAEALGGLAGRLSPQYCRRRRSRNVKEPADAG